MVLGFELSRCKCKESTLIFILSALQIDKHYCCAYYTSSLQTPYYSSPKLAFFVYVCVFELRNWVSQYGFLG